jgi:glycosyltransferase involved in cell wall biosynthesis
MQSSVSCRQLRVLQLGPYPPPHGGVQSNVVAIHRLLRKHGASSQIINITRHREPRGNGVFCPRNWFELLWLLARLRYDIIHLHIGGNVTPRLLALSFFCCAVPGRKTVLSFHSGGYPLSKDGMRARPSSLRGYIFRRFDRVIAVNPQIVQLFRRWGLRAEKIRLIAPYDLPPVLTPKKLPENIAAFFETHHPVLLGIGLLESEYDFPLQIDVLGLVRQRHANAGLVIIGSGSLECDLRKRINVKSYERDVLLCGDVPHEDALLALHASDVFLRTSHYDGDSIAVREALHVGVPVVATDTGMRPAGAHLIPLSNIDALLEAIEECVRRPREAREPGSPNETNIEAVVALYREMAGDVVTSNDAG